MNAAELTIKCESLERQLTELQAAFRELGGVKLTVLNDLLREVRRELDGIKVDVVTLKRQSINTQSQRDYNVNVGRY